MNWGVSPEELDTTIDNLRADSTAYAGGCGQIEKDDGSRALDSFLHGEGLNVPKDSAAYQKLRPLFRRALLENTARTLDRVESGTVRTHEPIFRDVFAHTPTQPARVVVTLGDMLTRYAKWLTDAGRSKGTHRIYEIPARILREVFSERAPLDAITKERMEGLFDLLRHAPANATQRYPGLTMAQAVAAADTREPFQRRKAKLRFAPGFYGLIVFVGHPRQLGESLLGKPVGLAQFTQAAEKIRKGFAWHDPRDSQPFARANTLRR